MVRVDEKYETRQYALYPDCLRLLLNNLGLLQSHKVLQKRLPVVIIGVLKVVPAFVSTFKQTSYIASFGSYKKSIMTLI